MRSKREWLAVFLMALVTMTALWISTKQMFLLGSSGQRIRMAATKKLFFETFVLFAVVSLITGILKDQKVRCGLLAVMISVFLWMHQVFLPVLVSGGYIVLLIRIGCAVRCMLDRKKCFLNDTRIALMADFTLGAVMMILLFCIMSLLGIGAIFYTRIAAVILALLSFLPCFPGAEMWKTLFGKIRVFLNEKKRVSPEMALLCGLIIAMILLQAGRMNICADYDSRHYGLRSEYVLNNGGGIYENLGNINVVYTYSKGLEILLFPLTGLPSYSFFFSFQMWMTVGILLAAGTLTGMFACRKSSVLCMAFLACIPGIMNMGITAKTDSMTALMQLIMITALLNFIQKKQAGYFALAGNAFFMTMVLKPTSLVFSTVVAGTAFLFLFFVKKIRFEWKDSFFLSWIPAVGMWFFVWLRTLLHTGIPVTSVFTSIWMALGFSVKYPFRFDSFPSNGGESGLQGALIHFFKRLYGVLLAPIGEDMAHVRIVWGTCLIFVFCFLLLLPFFVGMKKIGKEKKTPLCCLTGIFVSVGIVSLLALHLLWQVDGNYFILLYCLFSILAAIVIGNLQNSNLTRVLAVLLSPILLFNVAMTAVSNWSGVLGLSPVTWVHKGYFDHYEAEKQNIVSKGNEKIWGILEEDPKTRVIVYGNQPDMLMFPCNTQSHLDIAGSGGNYVVSSNMKNLTEFFEYAKIDYVYLERDFLKPETEKCRFVLEMVENGYLTDILYEEGNALARFDAEPELPEDPAAAIDEFLQSYRVGEQQ